MHFATAPFEVSDNQWHHYAFVFGANNNFAYNNIKFYVDANLIEASGHNWRSWSYDIQPNPITIAKSWPMGNYFSGELDDIAIWDEALTSDNISAIMNGDPNQVPKGLVHYWNFDEGADQKFS